MIRFLSALFAVSWFFSTPSQALVVHTYDIEVGTLKISDFYEYPDYLSFAQATNSDASDTFIFQEGATLTETLEDEPFFDPNWPSSFSVVRLNAVAVNETNPDYHFDVYIAGFRRWDGIKPDSYWEGNVELTGLGLTPLDLSTYPLTPGRIEMPYLNTAGGQGNFDLEVDWLGPRVEPAYTSGSVAFSFVEVAEPSVAYLLLLGLLGVATMRRLKDVGCT